MRNKRKIKSKNGLYLFNLRNSTQLSANSKTFINSKQDKSCQIYSVSMAVIKDLSTNYMKTLKGWIKYNYTDDFFYWYWKRYGYWKRFENNNILWIFINILDDSLDLISSSSLSINKKTHINIKCSLLNETLHFFKTKIFSIKIFQKSFTMSMDNENDSPK